MGHHWYTPTAITVFGCLYAPQQCQNGGTSERARNGIGYTNEQREVGDTIHLQARNGIGYTNEQRAVGDTIYLQARDGMRYTNQGKASLAGATAEKGVCHIG